MAQTSPGRALGVSTAKPTLDGLSVGGNGVATIDLGAAATDLVGHYGVAAVVQAAAITAISTSAGITGAVGFTATQAAAIIAGMNSIITALHNIGITA